MSDVYRKIARYGNGLKSFMVLRGLIVLRSLMSRDWKEGKMNEREWRRATPEHVSKGHGVSEVQKNSDMSIFSR